MAKRANDSDQSLEIGKVLKLVSEQDQSTQDLFAKALNIYFSPGSANRDDSEKLDQLRKALEQD